MSQMNSELVPLTLTIKVKLAFKLQQFLKKIELFFNTPSNLKYSYIKGTLWTENIFPSHCGLAADPIMMKEVKK